MPTAPDDPPLNPYEAPQTRAIDSQSSSDPPTSLPTAKPVLPRSTERWLRAALVVYIVSFVVPGYTLNNHWTPFVGLFYFGVGAASCWYPLCFAWWANVWFLLGMRKAFQARIKPATIFALLGVVTACLQLFWRLLPREELDPMFRMTEDPPYFCWLTAMVLLLTAVLDLRHHESSQPTPEPHDG